MSVEIVTTVVSIAAAAISVGALVATASQARSAREQADAAKETLRLMKDERAQTDEHARISQAQSVFLTHPTRQGGEASGDMNATRYPLSIHNRSLRDITNAVVTLFVDTNDGGGVRTAGFEVPRLLPDAQQGQMFKIEAARRFPYAEWTAWSEARFTDALGQRWLIDRDGQRRQIAEEK